MWTHARLLVAPQWANSSDPDFDVGFVVLQPHNGENIEQVLGASHLGVPQLAFLSWPRPFAAAEDVASALRWSSAPARPAGAAL